MRPDKRRTYAEVMARGALCGLGLLLLAAFLRQLLAPFLR